MSLLDALTRLEAIAAETPTTDRETPWRHVKGWDGRKDRCFWFDLVGGSTVVPTNQRRRIVDVDFYITYSKPASPSANRADLILRIAEDIRVVSERLLNVDNHNSPASGIIRISVDGREALAWSKDEDEDTIQIKISFPLEHT